MIAIRQDPSANADGSVDLVLFGVKPRSARQQKVIPLGHRRKDTSITGRGGHRREALSTPR